MIRTKPVGVVFREGDEVVLAHGSYQGTLGVFLRLRDDVNWAEITERNGSIRSHPVVWLAHATGRGPTSRKRTAGSGSMSKNTQTRGGKRGAAAVSPHSSTASMTGTPAQVEWAERIKCQVDAEFDRVAASFRSVAAGQDGERRAETEIVLAILDEKRAEIMGREQAGYFIHDWQEISSQVRKMILGDPRYEAIKSSRAARRLAAS